MDDEKTIKLPPWRGHTNPAGGRPQGPPPNPSHPPPLEGSGNSFPPWQGFYPPDRIPQGLPPLRSLGSQEGVQAQQGGRPDQGMPPLSSLVPVTRTDAPG